MEGIICCTVEGTINGRVLGEGKGFLHKLHSVFLLFSFRPSSLQKLVLITHLITGFTFMLVFWGVIHASHTMAFSSDSIHNLKWLDYTYLYFKKWIESTKNWLDIRQLYFRHHDKRFFLVIYNQTELHKISQNYWLVLVSEITQFYSPLCLIRSGTGIWKNPAKRSTKFIAWLTNM